MYAAHFSVLLLNVASVEFHSFLQILEKKSQALIDQVAGFNGNHLIARICGMLGGRWSTSLAPFSH